MATVATPAPPVKSPTDLGDDVRYEVIRGNIVEMPPVGTYTVEVATILVEYLGPFVRQAGLGRMMMEALFRIDSKTQYRPDLAFISHQKWPTFRRSPDRQPWDIVPDLVVEIISTHDNAWEVLAKVRNYLDAGCRSVWLVYPNLDVIHIYESFARIRVLVRGDVLDGGDVIPGFRLPLDTLFQGEPAEEDVEDQAD